MNKLVSARFWISLLVTIAFCYLSVKGSIDSEAFMVVFIIIVKEYFDRKDRGNDKS